MNNIVEPKSSVTILRNIVNNCEQCWQQNIFNHVLINVVTSYALSEVCVNVSFLHGRKPEYLKKTLFTSLSKRELNLRPPKSTAPALVSAQIETLWEN